MTRSWPCCRSSTFTVRAGAGSCRQQLRRIAHLRCVPLQGFVVNLLGLSVGLKIVTMPRFDLELFLKTIQNERVTYLHVVRVLIMVLREWCLSRCLRGDNLARWALLMPAPPAGAADVRGACQASDGRQIRPQERSLPVQWSRAAW